MSIHYHRPSFTHVSTHQTYVGKALYEHARSCATIAAVACMSSSLLKSSLGPNLLALIPVEDKTFDLFDKIFLEFNPHMQLTQKLVVVSDADPEVATVLINKIKSNGPLFPSSLQHAEINLCCLRSIDGFRSLRSLSLSNMERCEQLSILKSLPSLSELELNYCRCFDAIFFEALGDLENNRNFTSLDISGFEIDDWCSEGFRNDFCGRLLSKDRLTNLGLPSDFWNSMNEEDDEAFVNTGMTHLVELKDVPASLIRGQGFVNLRILKVIDASDEDLVNVGNHCLFVEVLELGGSMTGSFLNDENLVVESFKRLRELKLGRAELSDADAGQGFTRLLDLEKFVVVKASDNFEGSCLQHLPNPDRLRTIIIHNGPFSFRNLLRFVNLEELVLWNVQLSPEDVLSCDVFKQLKQIHLSRCGFAVALSAPFRILCLQNWQNLEELVFYGAEASGWTEEDVEAILIGCNWLRSLEFRFGGATNRKTNRERMHHLSKKYPSVILDGELKEINTNEATTEQESGSRREREE